MSVPTIQQAKKIQKVLKRMGASLDDEPTKKDIAKATKRAEESDWFQEQPAKEQPKILELWIKQEAVLRCLTKRGVTKASASKAIAYGEELLEEYDFKSMSQTDKKHLVDEFIASIFSSPPNGDEEDEELEEKEEILKKLLQKFSKEDLLKLLDS